MDKRTKLRPVDEMALLSRRCIQILFPYSVLAGLLQARGADGENLSSQVDAYVEEREAKWARQRKQAKKRRRRG